MPEEAQYAFCVVHFLISIFHSDLPRAGPVGTAFLRLFDFLLDLFRPFCIECFFIRSRLAKQSEKLPCVNAFFIGNVLKNLAGKMVVCGFSKLHLQLDRFILLSNHERDGTNEFLVRELAIMCDS